MPSASFVIILFSCFALLIQARSLPAATPVGDNGSGTIGPPSTDDDSDSLLPGFAVGEISYLWNGSSSFDDIKGAGFTNSEGLFSVPIPLVRDDDKTIATGIYYRRNHMEFSRVPFLPSDIDLHQIYVPFNFLYHVNDRLRLWFYIAPGLISDFVDLDSDAFDIATRAVALYKKSERLTLVAGLTSSREFGERSLSPIFGSIWSLGPQWRARLTFPRPTITYAPRDGTIIELKARPGGGGWSYYSNAKGGNRDLDYSSIRVGLSGEQQFSKLGWAFLESGLQFAQEFDIEGGPSEEETDGTWYLQTGLRLRF